MSKNSVISKVDEKDWSTAQSLEFDWWAQLDYHVQYRIYAFTHLMMKFFQIPLDQPNKTVLDIGCGPVPRIGVFRQATLIGLDPLLDKYEKLAYNTFERLDQRISSPVEQTMPSLEGAVDLLVSVNVLDHCYDTPRFLANCAQYLRPDGLFLLSFDLHPKLDNLHPLCIDKNTALSMCSDYFEIECFVVGLPWKNKVSYHGDETSRAITLLLAKKGNSSWWQQQSAAVTDPIVTSNERFHLLEAKLYALQDRPPATYPSINRALKIIDKGLGLLEYYPLKLYRYFKHK